MTLAETLRDHLSLMHGWIPTTVQIIAATALVAAIGWRTRRWRLLWLPWAVFVGAALAVSAYWYVASQGLAGNPAPHSLWIWIALSGVAAAVFAAGWRGARWWRRGVSVVSVPLCLLCAALALNLWTGYFPTVQTAWNQLTAGPLPDQIDPSHLIAMQKQHKIPARGTVVPVDIGDVGSGFRHRGELVYLPPAWYAMNPPPRLPTLMMIGGELNTPADWLRAGNAVKTIDDFAAAHRGYAPVLVFVDAGGAFNNDTECVNGTRGRAADHLTKDVVPYMISHFAVSPDRSNWGIVGWSMGGTCAVDLTVMHPELFSVFEDIAGDSPPTPAPRRRRSPGCSAAMPRRGRRLTQPWSSADTPRTAASRAGSTSTGTTPKPPPRTRCVRRVPPTASAARWSPSRVRTTGHSRRARSPRPCPGWPVNSVPPRSRQSHCRDGPALRR